MTETATDKRIDDLARSTDRSFQQVDQRFEQVEGAIREVRSEVKDLRAEMKSGFAAMDAKWDAKFDSLNRTIIFLLGGSLSVVTGGLIAAAFSAIS